jgi:hypothetical protein
MERSTPVVSKTIKLTPQSKHLQLLLDYWKADPKNCEKGRFEGLNRYCVENNLTLNYPVDNKVPKKLEQFFNQLGKVSPIFHNYSDQLHQAMAKDDEYGQVMETLEVIQKNITLMDPKSIMRNLWDTEIIKLDQFLYAQDPINLQLNIDVLLQQRYPNYKEKTFQEQQNHRSEIRKLYIGQFLMLQQERIVTNERRLLDPIKCSVFDAYMENVKQLLYELPLAWQIQKIHEDASLVSHDGGLTIAQGLNQEEVIQELFDEFKSSGFEDSYYKVTGGQLSVEEMKDHSRLLIRGLIDYLYSENEVGEFHLHVAYNRIRPLPAGWYTFQIYRGKKLREFEEAILTTFIDKLSIHANTTELHADTQKYVAEKFGQCKSTNKVIKGQLAAELTAIDQEAKANPAIRAVDHYCASLKQARVRVKNLFNEFFSEPRIRHIRYTPNVARPISTAQRKSLSEAIQNTVKVETEEAVSLLKEHPVLATEFIKACKSLRQKLDFVLSIFRIGKDSKMQTALYNATHVSGLNDKLTVHSSPAVSIAITPSSLASSLSN